MALQVHVHASHTPDHHASHRSGFDEGSVAPKGLLGAASLMEHARKPAAPGERRRSFELLGGSVAPPGFVKQTGVDEEEYLAILALKAQLERTSKSSERDVLLGAYAALSSPLADLSDVPAHELWERVLACPAVSIKFLEVSCKTNHQMQMLERVVCRTVLRLPAKESVGPKSSQ